MAKEQTSKVMRGAGRCPKCGCRKVNDIPCPPGLFYGDKVQICTNPACKAMWEPFDPAQLLDDHHLSCFKEPCDNCAFRPGSPEQQDTRQWKDMIAALKKGGLSGGFFCHKGVPIDPDSPDGFAYPRNKEGVPIRRKLRICKGWLNMIGKQLEKEWAEKE